MRRAFKRIGEEALAMMVVATLLAWDGAGPLLAVEDGGKPSAERPFRYDAKGRRDPFLPLVRDGQFVHVTGADSGFTSSLGATTLSGILWDAGGNSIALINGTEAKVGDSVDGYQISEIREDAVVLTNGGEPVVLQITFDAALPELSPGATKRR